MGQTKTRQAFFLSCFCLIEAIIAMPTDLFYNTGIQTYVWILSKNKRAERKGKIQLIDASNIYHKLRKAVGKKKNEFTPEDRKQITELYANFQENEFVKIFDKLRNFNKKFVGKYSKRDCIFSPFVV